MSRKCVVQPIEQVCSDALKKRIAVSIAALGKHYIKAFTPLVDKHSDDRRRILQIRVYRDDSIARCEVNARSERGFLAEVARQLEDADTRIAFGKRHKRGQACIGATVVNEHQLERHVGDGFKYGICRPHKTFQRLRLVVTRHNDGNRGIRVGTHRVAQLCAARA